MAQAEQSDYESFLIRNFIPSSRRDAYDAFRALNLELVRLPEQVSTLAIGQLRMQFWRDAISNTFAGRPPKEPIMILLHKVLSRLAKTSPESNPSSIRFWLLRMISTREKYMDNRPFPSLSALEDYAENTYSTLMYSTLAALSVQSMHVDHLASHIGKACGIAAMCRGIPILASPIPPVKSPDGTSVVASRNPIILLPLDIMAETGLREEDLYRHGPKAEGFQDAVFKVATRANDHLITAREMLKNIRAGEPPGHEYEHWGEEQHVYPDSDAGQESVDPLLRRGFGVLLESVPAHDYLTRLEAENFDPFTLLRTMIARIFAGGLVMARLAIGTAHALPNTYDPIHTQKIQLDLDLVAKEFENAGFHSTIEFVEPLAAVDAYLGPIHYEDFAINAPSNCLGQDTFDGSIAWLDGLFDPNRCADSCTEATQYNIKHGQPDRTCRFFNTYMLKKDGVNYAQYCSMVN
ncbi:hypothetical protein GQX73_g10787 [Xylaria multiplex]|uniref:Uncharacterized protein n=1 Tax=Xylaria multiplex TaxID=323545 RepID=A0A7C8MJA5_9PEZI|nr:hypothetical protein GQX73_g10787 [Xylaria multiplex]